MGTKVVTLKLPTGEQINAEVDDVVAVGVRPVGIGANGELDLDAALKFIRGSAAEIQRAVSALDLKPEVTELTFGLKFSASAGVILAKAESEANLSIKLQWKK